MLEFLEDNRHVAYPFTDGPDAGLHDFFVDAYIAYTKNPRTDSVKLTHLSLTRVVLAFDSDSTILCDLTHGVDGVVRTQYTCGDFIVFRWVKTAPSDAWFTAEEFVVQFVVTSATVTYPITPLSARLISSLVNRVPDGVRKISIKSPGVPFPSDSMHVQSLLAEGCCVVVAGKNMNIGVGQSAAINGLNLSTITPARPKSSILLEAVPGAGTGRVYDCVDEDPSIKTIKRIGPAGNGNFSLFGDDCIWVERELVDADHDGHGDGYEPVNPHTDYSGNAAANALKLRGNCKACCDCDDYGAAYAALAAVWALAKETADKISDLNRRYEILRLKRLASKQCTQPCIVVRVNIFARPDYSVSVAGTLKNNCTHAVRNSTMHFNIDGGTGGGGFGTFEQGSGLLLIGNNKGVHTNSTSLTIPVLEPGEQASYSFNVRFGADQRPKGMVVRASLSATTTLGNGSDTASTGLRGPLLKT